MEMLCRIHSNSKQETKRALEKESLGYEAEPMRMEGTFSGHVLYGLIALQSLFMRASCRMSDGCPMML